MKLKSFFTGYRRYDHERFYIFQRKQNEEGLISIARTYECSAMHNIPNTYPSLHHSTKHMTGEIETTTPGIEAQLLKRLSRMYEAGISVKDISEELKTDEQSVKRLLKLLGYASATI